MTITEFEHISLSLRPLLQSIGQQFFADGTRGRRSSGDSHAAMAHYLRRCTTATPRQAHLYGRH